jgi:hypothetical protein
LLLYELLKIRYPTAPFTLIALGADANEFAEDWGMPHIKNIYISEDTVNITALGTVFWQDFVNKLVNGFFK